MEIELKSTETTPVHTLKKGDCFLYDGEPHIVVEIENGSIYYNHDGFNAVNLKDGGLCVFHHTVRVQKIEGKFVQL